MDINKLSNNSYFKKWFCENADIIFLYAKKYDIIINELDVSIKLKEELDCIGILYMSDVILKTNGELSCMYCLSWKTVLEISKIKKEYIRKHKKDLVWFVLEEQDRYAFRQAKLMGGKSDGYRVSLKKEIKYNTKKRKIIECYKNDELFKRCAIELLGENPHVFDDKRLSARTLNALDSVGVHSLHGAMEYYPNGFSEIKNMGEKSCIEICTAIENCIYENLDLINQRKDDYSVLLNSSVDCYIPLVKSRFIDSYVNRQVESAFENIFFKKITFQQLKGCLVYSINDCRIKEALELLISKNRIKQEGDKYYRIYPCFRDVANSIGISDFAKEITVLRLSGLTYDEIADKMGTTRERSKHQIEKNIKYIRSMLKEMYGSELFDEDRFVHLYTAYNIQADDLEESLGASRNTADFLKYFFKKGDLPLEMAVEDIWIDQELRRRIKNHLDRSKLLIDGRIIERQRSEAEKYAMSRICAEEITFDDYFIKYNELLEENGIEYDEKIYYREDQKLQICLQAVQSQYCLWNKENRLRYYNISANDYTELFDAIGLDAYKNTEISTLKFFNEHPMIMKKYDIRNEYELHNLLKKTVDCSEYKELVFGASPIMTFGNFERDKVVYDAIVSMSPVTADELADYFYAEYGFEKELSKEVYFSPFESFLKDGVYNIEHKSIPGSRLQIFKKFLRWDFYNISELRSIYLRHFENADPDEINSKSLTGLGYNVYTNYIMKNHDNLDSYFRSLLGKKDTFLIKGVKKRYGRIGQFSATLNEMRREYEIMPFGDGGFSTYKFYSGMGIDKERIKRYCKDAYDLANDNEYFTLHLLESRGFVKKLSYYGFFDRTYCELLAMSGMFSYSRMYGTYVFFKGKEKQNISKKSFLMSVISKYESVYMDRLLLEIKETYGIEIPHKYELLSVLYETGIYYDEVTNKVYQNKSCFDLDDTK